MFNMRREHAELAVFRVGIPTAIMQIEVAVITEAPRHVLYMWTVKSGYPIWLLASMRFQ